MQLLKPAGLLSTSIYSKNVGHNPNGLPDRIFTAAKGFARDHEPAGQI
jgi:hypothetical protein